MKRGKLTSIDPGLVLHDEVKGCVAHCTLKCVAFGAPHLLSPITAGLSQYMGRTIWIMAAGSCSIISYSLAMRDGRPASHWPARLAAWHVVVRVAPQAACAWAASLLPRAAQRPTHSAGSPPLDVHDPVATARVARSYRREKRRLHVLDSAESAG